MQTLAKRTFSNASELTASGFALERLDRRKEPQNILMCSPDHFEVKDAKNPFMHGHLNNVDRELARRQWQQLKELYEGFGRTVHVLPPVDGFEDMVFAANQVLPDETAAGVRRVLMAQMVHESRRREVPYYERWFSQRGYEILHLSSSPDGHPYFEGQGDAIWHPVRRLLWGGFGHRTEASAYAAVAQSLEVPVLMLELTNRTFYHLDTCFAPLDESSVLLYPHAFSAQGMELIRAVFKNVIEVPESDARNFVCNALPLGRKVVLQNGSPTTCRLLRNSGFEPVEVDTSEFMKSGGSVFCLKMMVY